uniref:EvC ciliary complex subunit 2 n=1 Tax=Nothobranchius furzeri TaxID=105023 RepID=A0A8C6NU16_NOTFU
MFRVHVTVEKLLIWLFLLHVKVSCLFSSPLYVCCCHFVTLRAGYPHNSTWCNTTLNSGKQTVSNLNIQMNICTMGASQPVLFPGWSPPSSSAPAGPWGHSFYSSFSFMSSNFHLRKSRSTLISQNPPHLPPQVQSVVPPSSFRLKFHKCAQVKLDTNPPQLMFFLLIHNMGPVGGTNLSQVVIRDSISGIIPLKTEGRVVEKGYQAFAIDSLMAGSQVAVNYTAHVRSHENELLDLPAFLTFSNASQNDVRMFGPLTANLTLRVNSTNQIYPNHRVHFAGFVAGFFITLVLLLLGLLATNFINPSRTRLFQQRRNRCDSDPEDAECNMSETVKDEAAFEDKIVDVMLLEDPQNMFQALENLEMSSLLHATSNLEAIRIQIHKDLMSHLLKGMRSRGQTSVQAQQRLLRVLHGQLLGMEGRLKEERRARMTALAGQCNLETREEMEAEHCREAAEKAQAQLLCQHANQQELLQCSVLLEKVHKLSQSRLQRILLARHEEASAKVQRQIIEWRRVELHKIFSEELGEATRMGELEKSTARSLQHEYFTCQDQLEEVLDVVVANQRYVLSERSAQRKFLVHSLHSLERLISDTFSNTSISLDSWFNHIRRGSLIPAEQTDQLQEKAQTELLMVRQRLSEMLNQEKRALRCGLIKKRRELISNLLRVHKQRQRDLSVISKSLEEEREIAQHLQCWQSLLTAHCVELAELINTLDEEAAADIRKVAMRVIQGAIADIKAIQPSAAQAVLSLLPPGAKQPVLQVEPDPGPGKTSAQGAGGVLQGQERLQQEGKAALHTLICTRETLQEAMENELQNQREIRTHWRNFFRCLCLSQLTLSEDDRLRMKLEFQKCLSMSDLCVMLPHTSSRTKLHAALAAWRKEHEEQMATMQSEGETAEARKKTDTSDVVFFQKRLKNKIQLFEKEKEMESSVMEKVMEEMQKEREEYLHSQADVLAVQMATISYQKAEKWTKILEMSRATVTLQSLLIQQLRETKNLEVNKMAQSIHRCRSGLEEAEQLQMKRSMLDSPQMSQLGEVSSQIHHGEEKSEKDDMFQLQLDCRMTVILQEALHKCEQVLTWMLERFEAMTASDQAKEELKEKVKLKKIYANCDQDLKFASQLVMQSPVSEDVLLETLRLLLPTLAEGELLFIIDALCSKQHPASASAEQEPSRCAADQNRLLPVKLRENVVHRNIFLVEKLLPRSRLLLPRDAGAGEGGKQDGFTKAKQPELVKRLLSDTVREETHDPADENTTSHSAFGERLFVFRDPPESRDTENVPRRKKRNFLNLKKGSVAPTKLPSSS